MAIITNPSTASDKSVTIAVMGATGSGKTTFANLASGASLPVGTSLHSCTSDVCAAPPFLLDGKTVTLVDTPGFDDTTKSESEILRLISDFLAVTYEQGRKLNGVLYVHRISDPRMGGIARRNFRQFRNLCGDNTLANVVIVTNMWGDVRQEVGEAREHELASNDLFFKPVLDAGGQMVRHDNTLESAHRILRTVLGNTPAALTNQRERVDEGKPLSETQAGKELVRTLERQAAEHRVELDSFRKEVEEMMGLKDETHAREVEELRHTVQDLQDKLKKIESESVALREGQTMYDTRMEEMSQSIEKREQEFNQLQERAARQAARLVEMEVALKDAETLLRDGVDQPGAGPEGIPTGQSSSAGQDGQSSSPGLRRRRVTRQNTAPAAQGGPSGSPVARPPRTTNGTPAGHPRPSPNSPDDQRQGAIVALGAVSAVVFLVARKLIFKF